MNEGTCSKCLGTFTKIPTDRVAVDGVIHVDERGFQWRFNRCPDCCSAKARKAREEAAERARLGEHWDALIKQSRAVKSKDGRNAGAH